MEQNSEEPGTKYSVIAMETTLKLQRICSNVIGYCRAVINSVGKLVDSISAAPSCPSSTKREFGEGARPEQRA